MRASLLKLATSSSWFRIKWHPTNTITRSLITHTLQTARFCTTTTTGDTNGSKCADIDHQYGFKRQEMYKHALNGSVSPYQRHVFLCHGEHSDWPSVIEASSLPEYQLPHRIANCLKLHRGRIPKQTRFAVCQRCHGMDQSTSDVLLFPEMVMYKDIQHTDVEEFVDYVLVNETVWPKRKKVQLEGSHVFICSHGSRDMRCGVCGPALVERFNKEISTKGLNDHVFVRACSHIGGHKYAGNVIIYGRDSDGRIAGHWYGYVTLEDVSSLLDNHILKGQIVNKLWRGKMKSS